MATTTHVSAGFALVTAGDRTAEFRQARRRTVIVRILRWTLPAAAFALMGGYVITVLQTAGWGAGLPDLSLRRILPEDLAMNNPRYEGFGKDGSSYIFAAATAEQELATPRLIKLNTITGTILQADKTKTDITAVRGVFDHEASVLELFDKITVVSESGLKANLTRATIHTKESLLESSEPVVVEFPSGTVRANLMTLRQKAREISFVDDVKSHMTPSRPAASADEANAKKPPAAAGLFTPSDAPIDIAANRLDVNDASKIAVYSGHVTATQGDAKLTTPELKVSYEGGSVTGARDQQGASGDGGPANNAGKVHRIVAMGPVIMTRGAADVVTSDSADFDATQDSAVLIGHVVMSSGEDRRATSDRADLDQRADTALLTGNVVVVQGKNQLAGHRLFVDRSTGRTQMTSPPGLGDGPSRVTARLIRGEAPPKAANKPGAKGGGTASGAGGALGGIASFKTDPSAPIDVEADQLDVDDAAKVAVFRGDVHALQGGFGIKSAELYAYYEGGGGLADVTSSASSPSDPAKPATSTQLTRIEAKRDVVVTSKDGQTAKGDRADFDAKTNMATVSGDVLLTQGQNMVRGTRLVIDMTSGESTIDTTPSNTTARPAGGGWVTEAPEGVVQENRGRASAVFYPQQLKDAQKSGKKASESAPAPDGWSATADPGAPAASGN